MTRFAQPLAFALALCATAALRAGAQTPDWVALAEVEEIEVLTANEDGSARETTIWLAVLDGQGYIRTGGTRWGDNVERSPEIVLRIEGTESPVRATFVTDPTLREGVVATFRDKYGWIDGLLNVFRGREPRIMRIDPR